VRDWLQVSFKGWIQICRKKHQSDEKSFSNPGREFGRRDADRDSEAVNIICYEDVTLLVLPNPTGDQKCSRYRGKS
jgi:hypothetical protein